MNFLQRRRYRKLVKHVLHEAQHARHMREDVAGVEDLSALRQAEERLKDAWRARDMEQHRRRGDEAGQKLA